MVGNITLKSISFSILFATRALWQNLETNIFNFFLKIEKIVFITYFLCRKATNIVESVTATKNVKIKSERMHESKDNTI